jgi:glyoxylase-like metal-dependent hydrolase (beta-lactamase superfamily II)
MKKFLKWAGVALAAIVVVLGALLYAAFGGHRPIVDGRDLAPGVRTVKDSFVSAFVLDAGPGKVALVDAGNDKSAKAMLAELQRRGLGAPAVAAIFLTHGHPDHTKGCAAFPSAEVYAMAADAALAGDLCTVTHPLSDGEVVQLGDLRVEAFATPGHTPGSAVYLARGVLFFGDSAMANDDGTFAPGVRLFTKDSAGNVASMKALAARLEPRAAEVKTLAFAHTGALDGFAPLAAFAAKH